MLADPLPAAAAVEADKTNAGSWRRWIAVVSARRAGSLPFHCLLALLASLLPSLALVGLALAIAAAFGMDARSMAGPDREWSVMEFLGTVVFAPLCETLLLGGLLWVLSRLSSRPLLVAATSALLWGGAHGALAPLRFLGSVWTFYVLGCSYLAWRPLGFGKAFLAAAMPHMAINLVALLSLIWH